MASRKRFVSMGLPRCWAVRDRFGEFLGNGVVSAWMEGMTAEQPPYCQPGPPEGPVALKHGDRVVTAGGMETAMGSQPGADKPLVGADHPDEKAIKHPGFSPSSLPGPG